MSLGIKPFPCSVVHWISRPKQNGRHFADDIFKRIQAVAFWLKFNFDMFPIVKIIKGHCFVLNYDLIYLTIILTNDGLVYRRVYGSLWFKYLYTKTAKCDKYNSKLNKYYGSSCYYQWQNAYQLLIQLRTLSVDTNRNMMTSSNGNIFRVTGPLCGEFTGRRWIPRTKPVTRSFDIFFDLRLNKQLNKQSWGWWFETSSRPLWRHINDFRSNLYWIFISEQSG